MKRSGWLRFSALMLIIAGIMRIVDALWAFRYNGPVVNKLHSAIFGHSLKTYGYIFVAMGVILIASGILLLGPTNIPAHISRWIGVVASAASGIVAVVWLPYYPVDSLIYIGLMVLVIYGLVAHFDEEEATS